MGFEMGISDVQMQAAGSESTSTQTTWAMVVMDGQWMRRAASFNAFLIVIPLEPAGKVND